MTNEVLRLGKKTSKTKSLGLDFWVHIVRFLVFRYVKHPP